MAERRDPADVRKLRAAQAEAAAAESRRPEVLPDGTRRVPCRTVVGATYPQTPGAFYLVQEQVITGTPAEGAPATLTGGATFPAYNLGTAIPPVGQPVLVTTCAYRAVFRWDG